MEFTLEQHLFSEKKATRNFWLKGLIRDWIEIDMCHGFAENHHLIIFLRWSRGKKT